MTQSELNGRNRVFIQALECRDTQPITTIYMVYDEDGLTAEAITQGRYDEAPEIYDSLKSMGGHTVTMKHIDNMLGLFSMDYMERVYAKHVNTALGILRVVK